jgi:Xaa-Pro aminopeptidase
MNPERLAAFAAILADEADLAFLPVGSTDLHYLAGVARDIPKFGVTLHDGDWLEGAWIAPGRAPILALPRMSAELAGRGGATGVEIRVLPDGGDAASLARDILRALGVPERPRIALSDRAGAETAVRLQALRPEARFLSATALLRRLRRIKTPAEIRTMREAGRRTEAALAATIPLLRPGMTELDLVGELDLQMKRQHTLGPSFTTTLYCTGPDHPLLLGQRLASWRRRLDPPVSVLLDFGATHEGLCYDYGRTVCFGAPSAEQIRVHALVTEAQAAGIAALRAGATTGAEVDAAARAVIADAGFGPNFRHRLGHGIGWDVHEPPFLAPADTTPVEEGMLFTVEPSIWQDRGASARIEDVVLARPAGGERLTAGWPELIVVER